MSVLTTDSRIEKTGRHVESTLDGELVLMDTDSGRFLSLSGTGLRIWQLLDEHRQFGPLVGQLMSEFDVDAQQCETDVAAVLADMQARRMIAIAG